MATSYTLAIQQLYVAYFNRPADVDGLEYWEGVVAKTRGDLTQISKEFAASAEYKTLYAGMDGNGVVGQVYQNLFGRPADTAGLKYWVNLYNAGTVKIDDIVRNVSAGARGSDAEIVENRGKAAILFTQALDTETEVDAYRTPAGGALGRAFLAKITDDASFDAATTPDALDKFMAPLSVPPQVPVLKFDLTTGNDVLTGTANADQFYAEFAGVKADGTDATTLGSGDVIDGAGGDDTLNIHVGPGFNEAVRGTFKNIETIRIDNDGGLFGGAAGFINATKFEGAKQIWQMYDAVQLTHLGATTVAGFKSVNDTTLSVDADGASATLALETVKGDATTNVVDIVVGGGALNKVVVGGNIQRSNTGGPAASVALHVTTGQDAKGVALPLLTVTTAFDTVLTVDTNAETGALAKVDLASSSGGITYNAADTVTAITGGTGSDKLTLATTLSATAKAVTLDGGDGNDVLVLEADNTADVTGTTAAVKGGAGNDQITVDVIHGATKTVAVTVDGGAGDDVVHLKDGAGAYRFVNATDKLSGGDGNDTLVLATAAAAVTDPEYTKLNAVTGFERIKFANAVTSIDASKMVKIKEIEFSASADVTKLAAAQSVFVNDDSTITALSYNAAASGTGKNDASVTANVGVVASATVDVFAKSVALTVDAIAANAATAATLTGDVDSATVTLKSNATAKLASAVIDAAAAGPGFTSVTATGTGSIDIDNSAGVLKTINTSELAGNIGRTQIDGLTFAGNGAVAENITLGEGRDHLTLASYAGDNAAAKMDTVTGLKLVVSAGGFAASSDAFELDLSGLTTTETAFVRGSVGNTSTLTTALNAASALADNAVVFTMGGNTYLYVEDEAGATANGGFEATDFVVKLTGTSYSINDIITLASLSL